MTPFDALGDAFVTSFLLNGYRAAQKPDLHRCHCNLEQSCKVILLGAHLADGVASPSLSDSEQPEPLCRVWVWSRSLRAICTRLAGRLPFDAAQNISSA